MPVAGVGALAQSYARGGYPKPPEILRQRSEEMIVPPCHGRFRNAR
jgi:hypothetical protein